MLNRIIVYAQQKKLHSFTDGVEDLVTIALNIIQGNLEAIKEFIPPPKIKIKEIEKEVLKYIWVNCPHAEIHCKHDKAIYTAETCWDCKKGSRFERSA